VIDSSFTHLQYTSNVQWDLENFQTVQAHSSPSCPPGSADQVRPLASAETADSNHKFPTILLHRVDVIRAQTFGPSHSGPYHSGPGPECR